MMAFICRSLALWLAAMSASAALARPVELVDVAGRKVTVEAPAQRIVLGFYFEDVLAVGGPAAIDRVVGISREAWAGWRPDNWKAYLKVLPQIDRLADVGEVEVNTFSVEKVLAARPDVIILGEWQMKGIGSDFQRLAAAGIPIVVIDYHAQTVQNHTLSTRLIGQILGAEARAEQIAREYETAIRDVQVRIERAARPRPSVYIELGNRGLGEHGPSYGDYMWGKIAEVAGGRNIGRGIVATFGPLQAEQVLAARPDVVVLAGSEWRNNPTASIMGQDVAPADSRARLQGFTGRPGWSTLPAVQSGRVHGIYQGISRTIADYVSVQYFAKVLYPDLFADVDPLANYLAFYKRYLPIEPSGTFMVSIR